MATPVVPSIRGRLARTLLLFSLAWGLAVAAAVWLAVRHELDELLDDTLYASAEVLSALLENGAAAAAAPAGREFAWQVVDAHGQVLRRSELAPAQALRAPAAAGFADAEGWRVFGRALHGDGTMLYVAQTRTELAEAQAEVGLSTVLAALAIGWLGALWLRARVRAELEPLERLSQRLATHDPLVGGAVLGGAERAELQPVQDAIDSLARRLADRVRREHGFSAHAAHALRTPLAGIDAQLALALRDAPPPLQPRLQRARDAAGRLQRVVAALLALFRTDGELRREPVDVAALVARLPVEGLAVDVAPQQPIDADPDLLAAALLNLFDNALRHGARRVALSRPGAATLRLHDDGPGAGAERAQALRDALARQAYGEATGLGLMLADMVARSHGGRLVLPPADRGFAVELVLANAA